MGHPRTVEAVGGLTLLVVADLGERALVDLRVAPRRNERRHAAHGEGAAPVAGAHEQFGVGAHERRGHRDVGAVGQHVLGPGVAEELDDAEQVVPPPGVQARSVGAQFVEDLVHLERGGDRLDEHGRANRTLRYGKRVLGGDEDVVPQPRLEVALHLRQVVVRARVATHQRLRVVEEVQPEVDQRADGRLAVDRDVPLGQVPAAWANDDRGECDVLPELVHPPVRIGERRSTAHRVDEVQLALDDVAPVRGVRVLEIGQPYLCAGVERVDHHLALGRPGDLDSTVAQILRCGSDLPLAGTDVCGVGQEVEAMRCARPRHGVRRGGRVDRHASRRSCGAAWRRSPARRR